MRQNLTGHNHVSSRCVSEIENRQRGRQRERRTQTGEEGRVADAGVGVSRRVASARHRPRCDASRRHGIDRDKCQYCNAV